MRLSFYCQVFIVCLIISMPCFSQCDHAPADCLSSTQLPDSVTRLLNPVTPREVSMEIRLHDFFGDMLQDLADKNHWVMYQYDESGGSGYLNAERSGPLADIYRPPHPYEIAFIIIVNTDSFQIWKDWSTDNLASYQEKVQTMMAEYQKTGDQNTFKKTSDALRDELQSKTIMFRNSCMLRVKFQVNPDYTAISSTPDGLHWKTVSSIPHSTLTIEAHNNKIVDNAIFDLNQFSRCTDFTFVLFGNWNMQPMDNVFYHPQYHPNNKMDLLTPKKIPSDQVQAISMHVEGSPKNIHKFLQLLDTENISTLIHK